MQFAIIVLSSSSPRPKFFDMIFAILFGLVGVTNAATSGVDFVADQQLVTRLENGLGRTPILGWNGWARFPQYFVWFAHS